MSSNSTEMHLHFDIAANFRGTFVVDAASGAITVTGPDSTTPASTTTNTGLLLDHPQGHLAEPMVVRHEHSGRKGTRSREMAIAMLGRGWTVKPGPKYLRWIYQGDTHRATVYQNSKDILTRNDPPFMANVGKPSLTASGVRWRYDADSFDNALAAIETIETWADGTTAAA